MSTLTNDEIEKKKHEQRREDVRRILPFFVLQIGCVRLRRHVLST